jgi:hypothetical protein
MKKMTFSEFHYRMTEVQKSRRIFIESGLLTNITTAFEIYQEILAEEKLDLFVSTAVMGNRPMSQVDDYIRPKCPECQEEMRLRIGAEDGDGNKWETSWVCEKCFYEEYSNKNILQWMGELERAEHAK